MDINIRAAIIHNLKNNTQDQITETIVDAIQTGEEKTLPGLGVLFEMLWQEANEMEKDELVRTLEQALQKS